MNKNDIELLRQYAFENSEAAFAELVRQHIDLVYAAALRQVNGDAHLAQDVTQAVFTDLARKALRLTRHPSLAGWLYTSTRFAAGDVRRAQQRRSTREQEAHAMSQLLHSNEPAWEELRPVLDDAMHELKAEDREAVLLRFFERLPLAGVGTRLGVSENTARMRVARALERLREALARRGVTSSASALAMVLGSQAAQAAPVGLASSVSSAAVAAAGTASGLSVFLAKCALSTNLKVATAMVAAALLALPLIVHWQRVAKPQAPVAAAMTPPPANGTVENANAPASEGPALTTQPLLTDRRFLKLTLLAADVDKPVPAVEVTCTSTLGKEQHSETFTSRRDGRCEVSYPTNADAIEIASRTDGFADTFLHWEPNKGDTIPTNYTLRLLRAVHIGGYVQQEDGSPVPGITVEFRKFYQGGDQEDPALVFAHEHHQFTQITAVTDAEGRWTVDRIAPDRLARTAAMINHPDYLATFQFFANEAMQEQLRKGVFVLKLSPAPKESGIVVDPQGNALPGAKIVLGELGKDGMFEKTTTQPDGTFVVKRGQAGPTLLSVTAKGFVPKVVRLDSDSGSGPRRVVLEPGHALPLRVVDEAGRAVPGARILANLPGTTPAPLATTDAQGKALVEEAPFGSMALVAEADHYVGTEFSAAVDGHEHLVVLARDLTVFGSVTDAVTGQPIRAFRVTAGSPVTHQSWPASTQFKPGTRNGSWFKFGGGKFRVSRKELPAGNGDIQRAGLILKFEADGYASFESRVIHTNETEVQLDVALTPAQAARLTVLNPGGSLATDAEIGLVGGETGLTVLAGHLKAAASTALLRADSQGQFTLPADSSIKQVIAINAQGFAHAAPSALPDGTTLHLQLFGRLEGQWLAGNQPAPGRKVFLEPLWAQDLGLNTDPDVFSATTGNDGRFVFPQVPAGLYKLLGLREGSSPVTLGKAEVRAGETSTLTVPTGYAVSVRLRWPGDVVRGSSTKVYVQMQVGPLLPPGQLLGSKLSAQWRRLPEVIASWQDPQLLAQWQHLPEERPGVKPVSLFEMTEGTDGVWTAEGVPAGNAYTVEAVVVNYLATAAAAAPARTFTAAGASLTLPSPSGPGVIVASGPLLVTTPASPERGSVDAGEISLTRVP